MSLFCCVAYVVLISLPYIRVLTTQAVYTTILVFTVSLGLDHKICELFNDIKLIVIDGEGWQFHCILPKTLVFFILMVSPKSL